MASEPKTKFYIEIQDVTGEEKDWLIKIRAKRNEWTLEDLTDVGGVQYSHAFLCNAMNTPHSFTPEVELLNHIIIGPHKKNSNVVVVTNHRAGLDTVNMASNIFKSFLRKFRPFQRITFECLKLDDSTTYSTSNSTAFFISSQYIKTFSLKELLDSAELEWLDDVNIWRNKNDTSI